MGILKAFKKNKILKGVAIAAASYFGGPIGGMAAATLLSSKPKKDKGPDTAAVPTSPMAFLPAFSEMETRPQGTPQSVEGGDVVATSSDLLGVDNSDEEEIRKRRAARTLLG